MSHWLFVIAAYAVTLAGTVGLGAWSYGAMRRAERDAEALGRER